jgi:hypothetical protein
MTEHPAASATLSLEEERDFDRFVTRERHPDAVDADGRRGRRPRRGHRQPRRLILCHDDARAAAR